jgi:hypothetical protein
MEKLCQQFEEKLCKLLSFLTQLPSELETIADEFKKCAYCNCFGK